MSREKKLGVLYATVYYMLLSEALLNVPVIAGNMESF